MLASKEVQFGETIEIKNSIKFCQLIVAMKRHQRFFYYANSKICSEFLWGSVS